MKKLPFHALSSKPYGHADTKKGTANAMPRLNGRRMVYIKSFGLRAVLPVFSQYASWRNLPFSKTLLILIAPPQRLNKVLVPARCAFLDTAPAISLSSRKGISRNVRMYYSKEPKIKSNPKYTSFLDLTQEKARLPAPGDAPPAPYHSRPNRSWASGST